MICDICGGTASLLHKGTRDDPTVDVYVCGGCHTKFLNQFRENDYAGGFMNGKPVLTDEEIQKRLEQCRPDDERRAQMVRTQCTGKDVLDFGCGFGGFLSMISADAKDAVGVELGRAERTYLANRGYTVKERISDYTKRFDVITLFHVFEHLADPNGWLDAFASALKQGGILFVEVPNANDALLSLYECEAFADFTYWSAHLYLYTIQSLTHLIEKNGYFDIEEATQIQRYPVANHLYWLAKGKPGGQNIWKMFQTEKLNEEYVEILRQLEACDTLFFVLRRK